MSIITKKIKDEKCGWCGGSGCKNCNNTGYIVEYYSYFIDDNKKIAFGGNPGQ